MRSIDTRAELREELDSRRSAGLTVGFVPTMGFLHDGHLSLLAAARAECDVAVISVFVNPAQFAAGEDLETYPRDLDRDLALASEAGIDLAYTPAVGEMYPHGFATTVEVSGLTDVLCGAPSSRGREHFRGVTTVVAKLLNSVDPDVAYLGQKDAQQALVIKRMVRDLDFATRIEVRPTVREPDGLAMSSRNVHLDEAARERAAGLSRALAAAERTAGAGIETERALSAARTVLAEAGIEPEYLEARDTDRLQPVESFNGRPVLVAVAAQVGGTRLIDNVVIEATPTPGREDD